MLNEHRKERGEIDLCNQTDLYMNDESKFLNCL